MIVSALHPFMSYIEIVCGPADMGNSLVNRVCGPKSTAKEKGPPDPPVAKTTPILVLSPLQTGGIILDKLNSIGNKSGMVCESLEVHPLESVIVTE